MLEDNDSLLGSINTMRSASGARLKLVLWGLALVALFIIMGLVAYDIHLTSSVHKAVTPTPTDNSGYGKSISNAMDFSADPCTDFYQYSCGSLISSIKLPAGVDMYIPIFSQVQFGNYEKLSKIVTDQWPLIGDLYTSCMASSTYLESDTIVTFQSIISSIKQISNTSYASVFPVLASLHRMGVQAFFIPTVQENIFQQGSLMNLMLIEATLPVDLSSTYNRLTLQQIINSSVSAITSDFTDTRAKNVVDFEAALNNLFVEPDTYEDLLVNMTWSSFLSLVGINYDTYITGLNIQIEPNDTVIVATPAYISGLTQYFGTESNLQTLQDYMLWRVVFSYTFQFPLGVSSLAGIEKSSLIEQLQGAMQKQKSSFVDFDSLKSHLTATTSFTAQQIQCIDAVDTLLGDYLGLIFTMQVIDDDVVDDIRTVTGGIQNSFRNNLASLDWIDDFSRAEAVNKLNNILQIIGHPNKLERYRGLLLDPAHFMSNIIAIQQRVFDDSMSNLGTPYDRSDSEFPATIVNAFYNPEANTINFPAGILESPMFSSSFPKLMQYARMGYVIGHETTHGFDNSGRMWDAQGVFNPIMDDSSSIEFNKRAQCIVDQYNAYQPVPGYRVNGQQTLGENIADSGGVKNAFLAYKAWVQANGSAEFQLTAKSSLVPQLTNQQAFFVVLGQTWCTKASQKGIINQLSRDVHSPSQYRVNGPLSNLPAFAEAFSCKKGSAMNPTTQCELW